MKFIFGEFCWILSYIVLHLIFCSLSDTFSYSYGNCTSVSNNEWIVDEIDNVLVKFSISHAIAQSTKLGTFENRACQLIDSTAHLPEELVSDKSSSQIPFSRKYLKIAPNIACSRNFWKICWQISLTGFLFRPDLAKSNCQCEMYTDLWANYFWIIAAWIHGEIYCICPIFFGNTKNTRKTIIWRVIT